MFCDGNQHHPITAELQPLSPALISAEFLGGGGTGHVYAFDEDITIKHGPRYIVERHGNPEEEKYQLRGDRQYTQAFEYLRNEMQIVELLQAVEPHPNIMQSILISSDAIFFERLGQNIELYLFHGGRPCVIQKHRWV